NETITKKSLEQKAELDDLKKGHIGLEKKVDEIMTALFRTSFGDLVKSSKETFTEIEKKAMAKKNNANARPRS
ncbi:hypothetical protein MUO66_00705, partial [Candidatus Bathyarchaeota archaeon]|nr:hypothetical protein [Candidatus Bathyarchaeota archaeon]